jgi:acyl carrier protein
MDKDSIVERLKIYLQEEILKQPGREIKADEPLISSGLVDSFSLVDVALYVEDTFGVQIDDTELNAETFDTINELAELILSRQD